MRQRQQHAQSFVRPARPARLAESYKTTGHRSSITQPSFPTSLIAPNSPSPALPPGTHRLSGASSTKHRRRRQPNAPATSNKALAATSISCHRTTHTSEDLRPAAEQQPTDGLEDAAAAAVLDAERSRCALALLHQHHRPTSEEQ
ncbi:hypothetical protein CCHR01_00005 [Colletotrichum chrysophilum]|uniref:Uncharacterized protein n=1 Tax=Colletotrichum chrysophilum TaxID=1836956 RepID=A0AAD9B4C2_9PEZI|nr:hypothetical protein CCHR01_00005 [Colletotrichum chrysophilum]